MLDSRGNIKFEDWPEKILNVGYFPYYPPTPNWVGYGLNIFDQYDNGNNDWIEMDCNQNEWAVAYHGTKIKVVKPICEVNVKFFSINSSFYFLFLYIFN